MQVNYDESFNFLTQNTRHKEFYKKKNRINIYPSFRNTCLKIIQIDLCSILLSYSKNNTWKTVQVSCVKRFRIRSYPGPHFPAFVLSTRRYGAVRMRENADQKNSEYAVSRSVYDVYDILCWNTGLKTFEKFIIKTYDGVPFLVVKKQANCSLLVLFTTKKGTPLQKDMIFWFFRLSFYWWLLPQII